MIITIVADVLGKENNGTTVAAMNLIRFLKSKGHTVRVICCDQEKKEQEDCYVTKIQSFGPLNSYLHKNDVIIAKGNRKLVKQAIIDADAVHVILPFVLGHSAARLAHRLKKPLTASFHCQAENITSHFFLMNSKLANHQIYKVFDKVLYKYCDGIHYPTEFIKDVYEANVKKKTPAYVISNGVVEIFKPLPVVKPVEYKDKFVILFSGRYSKEKSHNVLIEAVEKSKYKDKIQLVFAGAGPLYDELYERCLHSSINMPVFKFFTRDELLTVINYSTLYCHPAEIEIEAIACLEALSCGVVPVIANSPRSATRFFALSEKNLFNFNDSSSLAEKIDYWLEHPIEREECSKAYLEYTKEFGQTRCMEKMEQMIFDAIEKKKNG